MLEIPESRTISRQASTVLTGKKIMKVINATSPHKFAWYHGDPAKYSQILKDRVVESVEGHGAFVDIHCDSGVCITISTITY